VSDNRSEQFPILRLISGALAPLLILIAPACAPAAEEGPELDDPDISPTTEPPNTDHDGGEPFPSTALPCYGEVEFPTAYCDEGTTCVEGHCRAAAPCTEVECDELTLVCIGIECDAPVDPGDPTDPEEPDPMDPPPPPPPPPEPPPTPTTSRLAVRLDWDSAGDMDLHLLNPTATRWSRHDDCNYLNCEGGLEWGLPGPLDNPTLSSDVTSRLGPERIVIQHPQPGTYRVGVDAYSGRSNVTVRIECGTGPRVRTLGPLNLGRSGERFWRVANIDIRSDGTCDIRPMAERATAREWDRR
jgi:hypothetical protein